MAKVIAILNPKGGTGKSTIALNVARALQLEGFAVLVIDSDLQGTVRDWKRSNENEDLFPVVAIDRPTLEKDIAKISHGFDYILIDGAAKLQEMLISALKVADIALVPVTPSAADLWGTSSLVELIKTRQEISGKPRVAFIVSRQIIGTRLSKDVAEALQEFGLPIFESRTSQRVVFAEALSRGSTVLDLEPYSPAAEEIQAITQELRSFINGG